MFLGLFNLFSDGVFGFRRFKGELGWFRCIFFRWDRRGDWGCGEVGWLFFFGVLRRSFGIVIFREW